MAWHYQEVHGWLSPALARAAGGHGGRGGFSEGWYLLATHRVPGFRTGYPSDPFQPVEIPLYLGLITAIYLLGVLLAREGNPRWLRRLVQAGADYSYGIYLSQVLFLTALVTLGWPSLQHDLPWPVVTFGGIVVVYGRHRPDHGAGPPARCPRHRRHPAPPPARPAPAEPKAPPIRDLCRNHPPAQAVVTRGDARPAFAVTSFRGRLGDRSVGYRAGVRRKLALAAGVLALVAVSGGAAGAAVTLSAPASSGQPPTHAVAVGSPAPTQRPLLAVVGASFSAGVGASHPDQAWPQDLARIMHWRLALSADPGAGDVNPGAGHRGPFAKLAGRLHLARTDPGTIIIQGGHDDIGRPTCRSSGPGWSA